MYVCVGGGATIAYGFGIYVVFVSEGLISNLTLSLEQETVLWVETRFELCFIAHCVEKEQLVKGEFMI